MAERRLTASAITRRKGTPFPVVTSYDVAFARFAEEAGCDVILVGDTLGMVMLGYDGTTPVTLTDMQRHGGAVSRGAKRAHVIVDLPFGTYEVSDEDAVRSSVALVKAGATSVKLEGGVRMASRIAAIVRAGIPVCGHIGVTPQTASALTGFRSQTDREGILADAKAVEAAGAFAIVLEMVNHDLSADVTAELAIPTIGIGSGVRCDSQVLVMHDLLGMFENPPPFVRRFAEIGAASVAGFRGFAEAVRAREYPPK